PATVVGHSLNSFCIGRPRPEAGPVSGRLTPIVRSARAVPASVNATVATSESRSFMGLVSWVGLRMNSTSTAQGLDVLGHRDRAQGVRIIGVALDEGAHLAPFADELVAAHDLVHLDEDLLAPLFDERVHDDALAVGDGLVELGVDLQQRRADDAA